MGHGEGMVGRWRWRCDTLYSPMPSPETLHYWFGFCAEKLHQKPSASGGEGRGGEEFRWVGPTFIFCSASIPPILAPPSPPSPRAPALQTSFLVFPPSHSISKPTPPPPPQSPTVLHLDEYPTTPNQQHRSTILFSNSTPPAP